MKRALTVSVIGHVTLLGALGWLGQMRSHLVPRGYPLVMMATLIQKPAVMQSAVAQTQAVAQEQPVSQPSEPEVKPVPSTKIGTTTKPKPIKAEKKSPPPSASSRVAEPSRGTNPATSGSTSSSLKIDAPEFPFPHYLGLLQIRIEANWQPSFHGIGQEVATVHFRIKSNGEIEDVQLEKSSGNFILDQAALRAVHSANPLPPLPSGSGLQYLGVSYEFSAN